MSLYFHNERARKEAAVFADCAYRKISSKTDLSTKLHAWLNKGLMRDLKLGRRPNVERGISFSIRSHFTALPDKPYKLEKSLNAFGFSHPIVFKYKAWNSDKLLEPDEAIIDILSRDPITVNKIGKVAYWFCSTFDNPMVDKDDKDYFYSILNKIELEPTYKEIFNKAIAIRFNQLSVNIQPWALNRFGLLKEIDLPDGSGALWTVSPKLDDSICTHLLRNRTRYVERALREEYMELKGLIALRKVLREKLNGIAPRCRWILVTGSVVFEREGKDLMEFDGGILRIASRSGKIEWYGLESKSGKENPTTSLQRRLRAIEIDAEVHTIDSNHAYCIFALSE